MHQSIERGKKNKYHNIKKPPQCKIDTDPINICSSRIILHSYNKTKIYKFWQRLEMSCIKARIYDTLHSHKTLLQQDTLKLLMFMERKIIFRNNNSDQTWLKRGNCISSPYWKNPNAPEDSKRQESAISKLQKQMKRNFFIG